MVSILCLYGSFCCFVRMLNENELIDFNVNAYSLKVFTKFPYCLNVINDNASLMF